MANRKSAVFAAWVTAPVMLLPSIAHADLLGSTVDWTLRFGPNGANSQNFGFPSSSVVGSGVEFVYPNAAAFETDAANRDTADFSGNSLTITDQVMPGHGANGWEMTFTAPGQFQSLQLVTSNFSPGIAYDISNGVITVDWLGTSNPDGSITPIPQGIIYSALFALNGAIVVPPDQLSANVVGAWANVLHFISTGKTTEQLSTDWVNCVADANCDYVPIDNQLHDRTVTTGLPLVFAAATSTEGLINETGINPFDPIGLIAKAFTDGAAIIRDGINLLNILQGTFPFTTPRSSAVEPAAADAAPIQITSVTGNGWKLDTGNYFDMLVTAEIDKSIADVLTPGTQFLTDTFFGDTGIGYGTVLSSIDPPAFDTVTLEFKGFEPTATVESVPEPSALLIFAGGLVILGFARRKRLVSQNLHEVRDARLLPSTN